MLALEAPDIHMFQMTDVSSNITQIESIVFDRVHC